SSRTHIVSAATKATQPTASTLTNTPLTRTDGITLTLATITKASLADTTGGHTIDVSGWTGGGSVVNSGAGTDTIKATKNAGFTLSNTQLTGTDGLSLTLSNLLFASLTDTGGNHTFDVSGWSGRGSLINSGVR